MSYIGNDLRSGRSETYVFTASGDETSVTASDDSRAINYTVGWERVWLNGVLLVGGSGNDYLAETGNSITGLAALSANDILVLEANHTFSVSDSVPRSGGTFDGGVTFGDTIVQTTSKNITGTLTENALYLSNAFVMTGNITLAGKSTLARITGDDAVVFLTDTDGQTITVGGTLTLGTLV